MNSFKNLGIHPDLVMRLNELGIKEPSPIQQETIPFLVKKGGDFIGMAHTGTGKTAAYGLPLLQKININSTKIQGLVLAPTRELVQQIAKALFKYTKYFKPIYTMGVYGGPNLEKQIASLKKPTHIIVATPGRLIDLINRKKLDLSYLKYLVLDEADEMLKLGFREDLNFILTASGDRIDKWLFSATMPNDIEKLIQQHLHYHAKRVLISMNNIVNANIRHEYIICKVNEKLNTLVQFLKKNNDDHAIVFCRTKKSTIFLVKQLISKGFECQPIHGDMAQVDRDKTMRAFRNHSFQLLISTDVSARGINIDDLNYIVHYEMPSQIEYYTHRSGRTARGGKKGLSLALVDEKELKYLKSISISLSFHIEETLI